MTRRTGWLLSGLVLAVLGPSFVVGAVEVVARLETHELAGVGARVETPRAREADFGRGLGVASDRALAGLVLLGVVFVSGVFVGQRSGRLPDRDLRGAVSLVPVRR